MQYGNPGYPQPQQAVQLPFNPTALDKPLYNLNDSYPPVTFNFSSPVPQLDYLLPFITARCAIEIQRDATEHPLRIFTFNRATENNFNNQYFAGIVNTMVMYIALLAVQGRLSPMVENDVAAAAEMIVRAYVFHSVVDFPALGQFVPQNKDQAVNQEIQNYKAIANELLQYQQHLRGQQQPQRSQYGGQINQGGGAYGGQRSTYGGQQQPQYPGSQPQQQFHGNVGMQPRQQQQPVVGGHRSTFFTTTSQQVNPNESAVGGRFSEPQFSMHVDDALLESRQVNNPRFDQQVEQTKGKVMNQQNSWVADTTPAVAAPLNIVSHADAGDLVVWKPTDDEPYFPAYRPSVRELFLVTEPNGHITTDIQDRNNMDFNQHNLPNIFGGAHKYQTLRDPEVVQEELVKGQDRIDQEAKQSEIIDEINPDQSALKVVVSKSQVFEVSESTAWHAVALKRARLIVDDKVPVIYRAYAQIAEPVISTKDDTDYVKDFATSTSYLELRKKLIAHRDTLNPELAAAINRRFTKALNRQIKSNLSIPAIFIDSFVDDVEDLLNVIEKRYGDRILKLLHDNAPNVIKAVLSETDSENCTLMTEDLISRHDYDTGEEPKITYLASYQSLTLLHVLANELDVELNAKNAATLSPPETPVMYRLVKELFGETKAAAADGGFVFERHLIRTLDGRVLEATEGYVNSGCFQLTLIS